MPIKQGNKLFLKLSVIQAVGTFSCYKVAWSGCLKPPSDQQELACEQGVLDSRMGNLFCCIFLPAFLPLFRNHLKILGVVFVTSVKYSCVISPFLFRTVAILKYRLKRRLRSNTSSNCLKACKLKSFNVYLIFFVDGILSPFLICFEK